MSEHEQIIKEYHDGFFKELENIGDHLSIKTHEDEIYKIQFTNSGWLLNETELFETFESCFISKSSGFKSKFHGKLFDKLSALQNDDS
ncbi:hypothetical protein BN7_2318 [Wickerhamomyces ciferrii]|uniref:GSKIP domain-containing protein n=1 Tax=Wickerhamomyces ciferrii (strain ATCC 14091 / BCRC 22168 / CBS 111 / JCM 3599 / NBRC 0793 / NRRL Y-1031 F-60-10) TaxID=1206466 RepID=K0KN58_WICCF|nr:uncharacterized protein BN7_2318 [Wickerhamomyces ciferrii]CCH42774.1 hypothetical protein BN7_2318 [Wickerhamomyces ciferrii]